jgi:hypothetical protein
MTRKLRFLAAYVTAIALIAGGGSVIAQPKDKPNKQDKQQNKGGGNPHAKAHKNMSGKALVGDKIKQNGKHKIHTHGKFATSVDVKDGKIAGVSVDNADKGAVPVTKYKTNKDMSSASATASASTSAATSGIYFASIALAQDEYLGTTWIGYAYIDDYGEEIIYWFPYDMILDGDTGAIDYYPAY